MPSKSLCKEYLLKNYGAKKEDKIDLLNEMWQGNIGICKRHLDSIKVYNTFLNSLEIVKAIENVNTYQFMVLFAKHEKNKVDTLELLNNVYHILSAKIKEQEDISYIYIVMTEIQNTIFAIKQNANLKLCITNLATKIQ